MQRIVILGRGASGKSTLARQLGALTGLPVIELDALFWKAGLAPTPREEWIALQRDLTRQERWIMDGDLGPYDALEPRISAADTVILLDFGGWRCAWRALRRSRERLDFWQWLLQYRSKSLPALRQAIAQHAPHAQLHALRSPSEVRQFLASLAAAGFSPAQ